MAAYIWTPDDVAHLYEFFRGSRPFKSWRLPESDEVRFNIIEKFREGHIAEYQCYVDGSHRISIAFPKHANMITLAESVAHEMIHLALEIEGHDTRVSHDREFKKRAKQVCKVHGFDEGTF